LENGKRRANTISRRKKIINMRVEINEMKNRKRTKKVYETKDGLLKDQENWQTFNWTEK
jgi:hypothetical protein